MPRAAIAGHALVEHQRQRVVAGGVVERGEIEVERLPSARAAVVRSCRECRRAAAVRNGQRHRAAAAGNIDAHGKVRQLIAESDGRAGENDAGAGVFRAASHFDRGRDHVRAIAGKWIHNQGRGRAGAVLELHARAKVVEVERRFQRWFWRRTAPRHVGCFADQKHRAVAARVQGEGVHVRFVNRQRQVRRAAHVCQRQGLAHFDDVAVPGADVHRAPVLAGDLELVALGGEFHVRSILGVALESHRIAGAPAIEAATDEYRRADEGLRRGHPQGRPALAVVVAREAASSQGEQVVASCENRDRQVRIARSAQAEAGVQFHRGTALGGAQVHRAPILGRHLELMVAGGDVDRRLVDASADVLQRIVRTPAVEAAANVGLCWQRLGVANGQDRRGAV